MRIALLSFIVALVAAIAAEPGAPILPASQATPTPSPSPLPTPFGATPTPSPTRTPTPTPTPLFRPTPKPKPSPSPSPTRWPSPTPSPSPSPSPSRSGLFMADLQQPAATPSQTPPPPAASPASPPSPSASPSEAGQPGSPVEYPKPSYADMLHRFDYDSRSPLELRETNIEKRGNVMLIEVNYAGASGDRVPAYLVLPHGGDNHPAIIWGHWLMKGSPFANKDEFLEEALVLARAGVISVLVDAPQARYDFPPPPNDLLEDVKQQSEASAHQVIDLRRAVDLLMVRKDIDRKRIAYVGHSWDAHVGAILAGVETRVCCYVLG